MRADEFWTAVTLDHSNFRESLVALLEDHGIRYCITGGQGVNAYVEPLVSLDLDLVIASINWPRWSLCCRNASRWNASPTA